MYEIAAGKTGSIKISLQTLLYPISEREIRPTETFTVLANDLNKIRDFMQKWANYIAAYKTEWIDPSSILLKFKQGPRYFETVEELFDCLNATPHLSD